MIKFYAPKDPYGCFSNFSRHPVTIYGLTWRTSEAAFQAMKFWPHRLDLVDLVWAAETPTKACEIARDRSKPIRGDWDARPGSWLKHGGDKMAERIPRGIDQTEDCVYRPGVKAEPLFVRTKDIFMYEIVYAKFSQHKDLYKVLIDTGLEPLIEDAIHDPYWGWGTSRIGENKLGRILMAVRYAFHANISCPIATAG
jgi:N-glycosidase YbiA